MQSHPLPRSAGRVPLVFAAVAVGALATPSLTYNVFADGGVVPLWVLTSGTAAQVLLLAMQIRLSTAHRRGSTLGLMADCFAGWASTMALLLLLGPEALSPPQAGGLRTTVVLAVFALCAIGTVVGAATLLVCRSSRDRRVAWATIGSLLSLPTLVSQTGLSVADWIDPWLPGAVALGGVLTVVAYTLTRAPQRAQRHPVQWFVPLLSVIGAAFGAVLVLALAASGIGDGVGDRRTVVLAVAALVATGARIVLLSARVFALQGAHEASLTDELTGVGNRRALLLPSPPTN